MRGVDYSNTSYRRMYQPTAAFKLLGCEAQSVYWALRQVLDPSGHFELDGARASEALAVEVGWSLDDVGFIERGLNRLLDREWVFLTEDENAIYEPDFYAAEHATKSGKLRTHECRQRKKVSASKKPAAKKPAKKRETQKPARTRKPQPQIAAQSETENRRPIGFQMPTDEVELFDCVPEFEVSPEPTSENAPPLKLVPPVEVEDQPVDQEPPTIERAARFISIQPEFDDPATLEFEVLDWPPEAPVTKCYAPETQRHPPVTKSRSQYPLPTTQGKQQAESDSVCARGRVFNEIFDGLAAAVAEIETITRTLTPDRPASTGRPASTERPPWLDEPPPERPTSTERPPWLDEPPCDALTAAAEVEQKATIADTPKADHPPWLDEPPWVDQPPFLDPPPRFAEPPFPDPPPWFSTEPFPDSPPFEDQQPMPNPAPTPDRPPTPNPTTLSDRSPNQPSSPEFDRFTHQVEAIFQRVTGTKRRLRSDEVNLVREWFDDGTELRVIAEIFEARAAATSEAIGTVLYFRKAVPEAWKRHHRVERELNAANMSAHTEEIDFGQCLDDLIVLIPTTLPGRADLVASMAELRGIDPETTEERLKEIERRYLGSIPLTIEQKQQIDSAMGNFAQRLPRSELPRLRKRLALQLKREGLGLPALSLFTS